MHLILQRTERGFLYTMGTLAIDGEPFCDTLEPTDRHLTAETMQPGQKVFGRTAIPTGCYPVELTYSPRFHRTLPLLRGVPCFEGIRIHTGNVSTDTGGCILVGRRQAPGRITDSRATLRQLLDHLARRPPADPITLQVKE